MPVFILCIMAVLLGAADVPAGLIGDYQVRAANVVGAKNEDLRSPRHLVTVTPTTVALRWDAVSVNGTITDCLVGEGAHSAPVVALTVKSDVSTYRVNFTFKGSEYTSEMGVMVEDLTRKKLIGTWMEGRKR